LQEEDFPKLMDHLSFDAMKKNPAVNHDELTERLIKIHGMDRKSDFIRKGKVGSWKEELSSDSKKVLDEWMQKNKIPGLWED